MTYYIALVAWLKIKPHYFLQIKTSQTLFVFHSYSLPLGFLSPSGTPPINIILLSLDTSVLYRTSRGKKLHTKYAYTVEYTVSSGIVT